MPRRPLSSLSVAVPLFGMLCGVAEAFVTNGSTPTGHTFAGSATTTVAASSALHVAPFSRPSGDDRRSTSTGRVWLRDSGEPIIDLERLRDAAARDPEASFQRSVQLNMRSSDGDEDFDAAATAKLSADAPKPKKKSGYRRIEEWAEQHETEMTWEERVQWEGQRHGNQIRQNDILIRNLHSF